MTQTPPRTVPPLPGSLSAAQAAVQSVPLGALLERLKLSRQRLAAVVSVLPDGLQAEVRAGPLDEQDWVLFVPGNAAAAKLRQCLPALEETLLQQGWPRRTLKVRILAPASSPPR